MPPAQSFDSFAAAYDRFAGSPEAGLLDWLTTLRPRRGRRALDAGCGSGRHAVALADRFEDVVAVDVSQPLIEIARRRRPHPRVNYLVSDLMESTDRAGFDLVFSHTVLHHLVDLDAALEHLRGLTAAGGTLVLVDNVAPRPKPLLRALRRALWAGGHASGLHRPSAPTPPRWVHVASAMRHFTKTFAPGAGRRRGGCCGSGRAAPGWIIWPATAI